VSVGPVGGDEEGRFTVNSQPAKCYTLNTVSSRTLACHYANFTNFSVKRPKVLVSQKRLGVRSAILILYAARRKPVVVQFGLRLGPVRREILRYA